MPAQRSVRHCAHCGNEFALTRRDRRFCGPGCRSAADRASKAPHLQPASPWDDVTRTARERLAWLRQQQRLPPLAANTRLDVEASLQAQRIALQVSEALLQQLPPAECRIVNTAFATDRFSPRDLAAASAAGCGAAWSADGRLVLVILLGGEVPHRAG